MRSALPVLLAGVTGCNQIVGVPDVRPGPCDPAADFVTLAPVEGLDGEFGVQNAWLSPDERMVIFSRITTAGDPPVPRYGDLHVAHRDDPAGAFGEARPIAELNSAFDEFAASMTDDLLTIYYDRQDLLGEADTPYYRILTASRSTPAAPFGPATEILLGTEETSNFAPHIVGDTLYFATTRLGGVSSLFAAQGRGASFMPPRRMPLLDALPPGVAYENPVVSADHATIYFSRPAPSARDIWIATRPDPTQPFGRPRAVSTVNDASHETPSWASRDGCRLYFTTDRGDGAQLWLAARRAP